MQTHFFHLGYKSWKWLPGVSRHNRPCLLCKVTTRVKVKPAIFGLGAHAPEASPVVSGLQKPPAGSGRGRGRGRKWSCLEGDVDMGGGDPFHTEDGATQKASTCGPVLTEPCRAFSTHGCKRGTSLPHHPHTQASLCSMGLGLYFKFTWSPEEMRKRGGERATHTPQANSEPQNLSYRVSKKDSDLHEPVPISPASPCAAPQTHSWCSLHFLSK